MKKICIITNKQLRAVTDFVGQLGQKVDIKYSGNVFDQNHQSLRIRKHDDGELYLFGSRMKNPVDCHKPYPVIPPERYVYEAYPSEEEGTELKEYKTVIAVPYMDDFESYLAIAIYLKNKDFDISKVKCLELENGPEAEVLNFGAEFEKALKKREESSFDPCFPISRDFRFLQAETHMDNKEFAEYFGMSVRNVENWRKDPASLKDYIYDLFEYKLLHEGII